MSKWWWKADYIESCNCAHGCPCNFTAIPTDGTCQAVGAYRIREVRTTTSGLMDVDSDGFSVGRIRSIAATVDA
jgi:hypothetical protein